jgi:hypothetical protein
VVTGVRYAAASLTPRAKRGGAGRKKVVSISYPPRLESTTPLQSAPSNSAFVGRDRSQRYATPTSVINIIHMTMVFKGNAKCDASQTNHVKNTEPITMPAGTPARGHALNHSG